MMGFVKFLKDHGIAIIVILVALSFGWDVAKDVFRELQPGKALVTEEVIESIIGDVIDKRNQSLIDSIDSLEKKVDILYYDAADEWERMIRKLYDYLAGGKGVRWADVSYMLTKWELLPEEYKTPELTSKHNYLKDQYDIYINNGKL